MFSLWHWSLVGIRPRLAQASCTAAVHSRQLMEFGEPPAAVRVPAWLPPDADRLHVGSPENDMNVLKEMVDRTLFFSLGKHNLTLPSSFLDGMNPLPLVLSSFGSQSSCCLADKGVPLHLSLSPSWLTHPLELDSFSSFSDPAPSGMVDVPDSGLCSSLLLILPVLGSLVVLTGKPHYGLQPSRRS